MEDLIYKEIILSHWKNPKNFGKMKNPQKKAFLRNPFCGDEIRMEAKIKKGKIEKIKFSGKGCIISFATASILTEYVKGKKIEDLRKLDKNFILDLIKIELGPTRLKCALLPLFVLQRLIK